MNYIIPIENKTINNRKKNNKIIRLWEYNNKTYTIDIDLLEKKDKDKDIYTMDISHIDGQVTIFKNLYKNMIRKKFDNILMPYLFLKNDYNKIILIKYNISNLMFNEECLWEDEYINKYKLRLFYESDDYICDDFKELLKYIKKCDSCKKWKYKEDIKYHLRQHICDICINNKCNPCIIFEERKNINNNIYIECKNKRSIMCNYCKKNLDPKMFLYIKNKYNTRCNICVKEFFENIPVTS